MATHQENQGGLQTLKWLRRIRKAMYGGGLELHAQPIFGLSNGRILRHELLLRIKENDLAIQASDFLGVARAYGPIREIDRWVVDTAARLAATGWRVSVNLSGETIDGAFPEFLRSRLAAAGVLPGGLAFEVTEAELLRDEGASREFAWAVRELGCGLVLDDFGSGDWELTFVRDLPVTHLKIDGNLVHDLLQDRASRDVVQASVELAKEFGQRTVAGKVEDLATLQTLEELGVDQAQGFALGAPAPIDESVVAA